MLSFRMQALQSIARHKSANGKYKGQVVTRCVVDKVTKQMRVAHKVSSAAS